MAGRVKTFRVHCHRAVEGAATPQRMEARAGGRVNRDSRRARFVGGVLLLAVVVTLAFASVAQAATPVGLGTAESFAVLAGSAVTNTGPTVINGNLGLSPGSAVSGFPPGLVNGSQYVANAVALQAQTDLVTAYNDAAGQGPPIAVTADLGGQTLTPGVYNSASSLGLTGPLTLDGQGDPNAVFIFQAGSTLTTASASSVNLIGGAQSCNVFWQVGSSATLGTNSVFVGSILALTSISLTTGATVDGRVLARNGAVTLDTNVITRSQCAGAPPPTSPPTGSPPTGFPPSSGGLPSSPGGGPALPGTTPVTTTPPATTPGTTPPATTPTPGAQPSPAASADVNGPRVNVTGVLGAGTDCVGRDFTARVRVRDTSGLRSVDVYLDGKRIERTTRTRFTIRIKAAAMGTGHHSIRVVARDRLGNRTVGRWSFMRCGQQLVSPQYTG